MTYSQVEQNCSVPPQGQPGGGRYLGNGGQDAYPPELKLEVRQLATKAGG